ncbi:MAG: TIGR04211 family SH3 domain-containing protein [Pseudomonadales bacterium]
MQRAIRAACAALLLPILLPSQTLALEGTVYVTDELRLGLYADDRTTGQPFRTFASGDKLEVLERALMSVMVRSEDGAEGWVKSAFLLTEPTAKLRLAALEKDSAAVSETLTALQAAHRVAEQRIEELTAELANAQAGLTNLPELERQNQGLQAQLAAVGTTVPRYWLAVSAFAALGIGCLAVYLWLDRRVRKKFGGVRVY